MLEPVTYSNLTSIEQAIIIQCIKDNYKIFGFKTADVAAKRMSEVNAGLDQDHAKNCLQGKSVAKLSKIQFARAAAILISEHIEKIKSEYAEHKDVFEFICRTVSKITNKRSELSEQNQIKYVEMQRDIFRNWTYKSVRANLLIKSGIYQLVRRYKPILGENEIDTGYDWINPKNHVVVFELLRIDSSKHICTLYSSEGNVFNGTFFLNHRNVVSMILQRKVLKGYQHRYITFKAEQSQSQIYAGISVKIGDTTYRPIASECFFIRIPEDSHSSLYEAFGKVKTEISDRLIVDEDSKNVIENYTSDNPPSMKYDPRLDDPAWSRVRFVRNFPILAGLVSEDFRVPLFREPLRVMQEESMRSTGITLEVFEQKSSKDLAPETLGVD